MLEEPRSGRLTAWGNALYAGAVSPDQAATETVGDDTTHRVVGLPEETGEVGLTLALGRFRSLGARGLRLALPVPGHPLGLSGPPEFNSRALEAGEAVLVVGASFGLVPTPEAAGPAGDEHVAVVWRCEPVHQGPPADVPTLGEAERELSSALRESTEALTRLDLAGAGPMAQAALEAYQARAEAGRQLLAPGYPPRAVRVLELAQRVATLVRIAYGGGPDAEKEWSAEHGSAVSSSQMVARAEVLRPVERVARRAQVAAYNAYAEEEERRSS